LSRLEFNILDISCNARSNHPPTMIPTQRESTR